LFGQRIGASSDVGGNMFRIVPLGGYDRDGLESGGCRVKIHEFWLVRENGKRFFERDAIHKSELRQ
jgi:hypothetical protein